VAAASVITDVSTEALAGAVRVLVQSTGPLQYTAFKLHDPPRVVVEFSGARLGSLPQPIPVRGDIVRRVEATVLPDEHIVRLTLHLRRMASYTIEAQARQLHITLKDVGGHETTATAPQPGQPEGKVVAGTLVTGVTFVSLPDKSVLAIQTSGTPPKVRVRQHREPLRLSLEVEDARLDAGQEKAEAVSDPSSAVLRFRAFQEAAHKVKIVARLRELTPFEVQQEENLVRLVIAKPATTAEKPMPSERKPPVKETPPAVPPPSPPPVPPRVTRLPAAEKTEVTLPRREPEVPPPAGGQPAQVEATTIGERKTPQYTGKKISLDFQNADINDILRLIAEVSGLNIIAGGDVQGTVTTRMVDVPWDQALDVILRINGLAQERDGNIIRVAPLERFISERQERLRARQTEDRAEPTVTQLVPVNYADASELKSNLERLLSDRGSIFIDARTNTLIVTDTRKNLDDILALVEALDRQTPQVMIEARIVETSRNFLRQLGVRLGAQYTRFTDLRFPNRVAVGGGIASDTGNFLVDLPAAVGAGSGGAIAFSLAGASNILDIQLSALESSGRGKIISNPKIATLDNTEALIQSGVRIPFETVSAEGTQTEFVDASISLKVTPHVTPDGFISMKIVATKNEPDFSRTSAGGAPTITTREATTEMLVKDNDTVVIGGLYRRTIQSTREGVPWLSRVPVLGWLFRNTRKQDDNEELLIFITPRIIRPSDWQSRPKMPVSY
jgi:type IV pilus secretin PilQ/predicted competence protein